MGWDLRLLPAALAAWGGALAGLLLNPALGAATSVAFVAALAAVLSLASRSQDADQGRLAWSVAVAGLVACLAWGLGCGARFALERETPGEPGQETQVELEGRVASDAESVNSGFGGMRWSATLVTDYGARVVVMVAGGDLGDASLVRGSRIQVVGELDRTQPAVLPYVGILRAESVEEVAPAPRWQSMVHRLKQTVQSLAAARAGTVAPLVTGMALGDDRGLQEDDKDALLTTSLTHLTAVSGSHVAIVVGLVSLLLPGQKRTRWLLTGAFLVTVVLVVGPEPAVIRSVATAGLALWGVLAHRSGYPLSLLAGVTIGTVLVSPWSAVSYGFALSTLATAGILTLGRHWVRAAAAFAERVPDPTVRKVLGITFEAVAISCAAQLVTLPVVVLMNPWVPVWGLLANVLVAPAVAPITVLGLAAAATVGWAPSVAALALTWAAKPAAYLQAVATMLSNWPGARLPWFSGWTGFVTALAVTVGAALGITLLARSAVPTQSLSEGRGT